MDIPRRGDIYWVDWSPGRGSEQTGLRPAVVIQNDIGNQRSPNVIVACMTTAPNKPFPFLVMVKAKESGLDKDGAIDLGSILTVDKGRLRNKAGHLPPAKMSELDNAICVSLGINMARLSYQRYHAPS